MQKCEKPRKEAQLQESALAEKKVADHFKTAENSDSLLFATGLYYVCSEIHYFDIVT